MMQSLPLHLPVKVIVPLVFALGLVLTSLSPALAILMNVTGGNGEIITAPLDMSEDSPGAENDHQQGFNEVQNLLLLSNLTTDTAVISAGTLISSHMIFLNTSGNAFGTDSNTWEFSGAILGITGVIDSTGANTASTSSLLGAPGTIYPSSAFGAYGLEGGDSFSVSGNLLTLNMQVTEPGDWIRVVTSGSSSTPIPEPSTMFLLGTGIVGIGLWRRGSIALR